ncbi:12922_t:CDS:2 [Cetraspora pellucida]|uniref:12922_t:CDS:1 n=1 Tax=Cetraspora pellucida TaxID=1433469 RepID=A0A9N9A973_9GLOM|nr:12922_t:CDS:2 [Cetraspora pellucida]
MPSSSRQRSIKDLTPANYTIPRALKNGSSKESVASTPALSRVVKIPALKGKPISTTKQLSLITFPNNSLHKRPIVNQSTTTFNINTLNPEYNNSGIISTSPNLAPFFKFPESVGSCNWQLEPSPTSNDSKKVPKFGSNILHLDKVFQYTICQSKDSNAKSENKMIETSVVSPGNHPNLKFSDESCENNQLDESSDDPPRNSPPNDAPYNEPLLKSKGKRINPIFKHNPSNIEDSNKKSKHIKHLSDDSMADSMSSQDHLVDKIRRNPSSNDSNNNTQTSNDQSVTKSDLIFKHNNKISERDESDKLFKDTTYYSISAIFNSSVIDIMQDTRLTWRSFQEKWSVFWNMRPCVLLQEFTRFHQLPGPVYSLKIGSDGTFWFDCSIGARYFNPLQSCFDCWIENDAIDYVSIQAFEVLNLELGEFRGREVEYPAHKQVRCCHEVVFDQETVRFNSTSLNFRDQYKWHRHQRKTSSFWKRRPCVLLFEFCRAHQISVPTYLLHINRNTGAFWFDCYIDDRLFTPQNQPCMCCWIQNDAIDHVSIQVFETLFSEFCDQDVKVLSYPTHKRIKCSHIRGYDNGAKKNVQGSDDQNPYRTKYSQYLSRISSHL